MGRPSAPPPLTGQAHTPINHATTPRRANGGQSTDAVDTTSEQPSVAEVDGQQPGKVMRIAATIKQLAEEVHAEPLDAPSRNRPRKMHAPHHQ